MRRSRVNVPRATFIDTAPHSILSYYLTDPKVMGWVGWTGTAVGLISLFVTIVGFWIAILQLKRVKRAAEAAQAAVVEMTQIVRNREQHARLVYAHSQLRISKAYLTANPGAAGAYLDTSCSSLLEAKQLALVLEDQDRIAELLMLLRPIGGELGPHVLDAISAAKLKIYSAAIQKVTDDVEAMSARLRYEFEHVSVVS